MIKMWAVAVIVYLCCKVISLIAAKPSSWKLKIAYFLWVGLDANGFMHGEAKPASLSEWFFALLNTLLLGICLLFLGHPIIGIVFILHFGLFHLLSLVWRSVGFNAKPLMNFPILANSLGDFWGNRWNTAFRDFSQLVFKPLARKSITCSDDCCFCYEWGCS